MANKITRPALKTKLTGVRIDISNMAQEMRDARGRNPEFFSDGDRAQLKELDSLSKKLDRIVTRL